MFGLHFKYRHQVDQQNNCIHVPTFLAGKWATQFYTVCNFAWYFSVSEVNTALVKGRFQNDGAVKLILKFKRSLEI